MKNGGLVAHPARSDDAAGPDHMEQALDNGHLILNLANVHVPGDRLYLRSYLQIVPVSECTSIFGISQISRMCTIVLNLVRGER